MTDYLPWLDTVADGLGLQRVHVVGSSYGGTLALLWAALAPDRVATASVLDPGGLMPVDLPGPSPGGSRCSPPPSHPCRSGGGRPSGCAPA